MAEMAAGIAVGAQGKEGARQMLGAGFETRIGALHGNRARHAGMKQDAVAVPQDAGLIGVEQHASPFLVRPGPTCWVRFQF